jgi:hypothetical protein
LRQAYWYCAEGLLKFRAGFFKGWSEFGVKLQGLNLKNIVSALFRKNNNAETLEKFLLLKNAP